MKTVADYNVTVERIHEQYWQGHGIACTDWNECATGLGTAIGLALDDCFEMLSQNGVQLTDEQEAAITAELAAHYDMNAFDEDAGEDCYYYVSIDVKLNSK